MKLSHLVLMVTEDCNFNCKYCYQIKKKRYMNWETAKRALDFFLPKLSKNYRLYFLGGEPLLALDVIKESVAYLNAKNRESLKSATYAISTNGSLLDEQVLDFLNQNHFTLELSFDGFAQDWGRKKNSFHYQISLIEKILDLPGISLVTNSAFTTRSVHRLRRSLEFIMDLGVPNIELSLDLFRRWNRPSIDKLKKELACLRESVVRYYRKSDTIPVVLYREKEVKKGIWRCPGGDKQLVVGTHGQIWGCPFFYEYFKDGEEREGYERFYFGRLEDFERDYKKRYRQVLKSYQEIRMDNFYKADSRCVLCPHVQTCSVCPVCKSPAYSPLLFVPDYVCEIGRILYSESENFKKMTGVRSFSL